MRAVWESHEWITESKYILMLIVLQTSYERSRLAVAKGTLHLPAVWLRTCFPPISIPASSIPMEDARQLEAARRWR
jgi:hypothetical protein